MIGLLCIIISLGMFVISVGLFGIATILERIADNPMNLHRTEEILERIADKIESEDKE